MDFFERQDNARRGTKRLLILFGAGVAGLTVAVYLALLLAFDAAGITDHKRAYYDLAGRPPPAATGFWRPQVFCGAAAGTLMVVLLGSLFKASELSKGGRAVATMLGGVPVNSNTKDPDERKLLNVVEEMAIASGLPVPQVYVLPQERGINAFAAGYAPGDAAIGVTGGAVRLLNRDELQGVIAHEFSHVLNGDMRLNMRLMAYVFGILCLAVIGRVLLRARGRKNNPLPLLGLALILIGWIGVFFGQLIQAAVSRQREHLADASAVQFTRNPLGLASALKKIGGLAQGSRLTSPQAAQASHMFFGNGLGSPFMRWMATHPPLEERIRALDPSFDGQFPMIAETKAAQTPQFAQTEPALSAMFANEWKTVPPPFSPPPLPPRIAAREIVNSVGAPGPEHIRYAVELRNALPEAISQAVHETSGAVAMVFALLLSDREDLRQTQMRIIGSEMGSPILAELQRLLPIVRQVAVRARLPLVDLALPMLMQMSPRQYLQFRTALEKVVDADGEIDLFEYMLQKIVIRHLEPEFAGARKPVVQFYSLKGLAGDCQVLLSGLAHVGAEEDAAVQAAFQAGAQKLSYTAQAPLQIVPPEQCGLDNMDAALARLSQAVPQIRKNVLSACALTVASDGLIKEEEAELLRAVADALDCPLPPTITQAA